jgi:hypothetical protein
MAHGIVVHAELFLVNCDFNCLLPEWKSIMKIVSARVQVAKVVVSSSQTLHRE